MKFQIKNTMEGTYMFEQSDNWEIMLSNHNRYEALLMFSARYVTSMSKDSYDKIAELFASDKLDDVDTIIIDDWAVTFKFKNK